MANKTSLDEPNLVWKDKESHSSIVGCCAGGTYRHEVCSHAKAYISAQVREARLDEARYIDEHIIGSPRKVTTNERMKARLAELNSERDK